MYLQPMINKHLRKIDTVKEKDQMYDQFWIKEKENLGTRKYFILIGILTNEKACYTHKRRVMEIGKNSYWKLNI